MMLSALSLILYKEFHISAFQLTLLVALKPASALLAAYWSSIFNQDRKNLVTNLVIANIARFVPFLFIFWIHSAWYLIISFGLYMAISRGCVPVWMELFKMHLCSDKRSKVFVLGNTLEYIGTTLLPVILGIILDFHDKAWHWIFPLTGMIGLLSTFFLLRVPAHLTQEQVFKQNKLTLPWKQALKLLMTRPDFCRYQIGFMLGGAGLMILQPALPIFFVDTLKLNYTEMLLALTACKGLGFTLASPIWNRFFKKSNFFIFSAVVALLAALFPPLLLCAKWTLPVLFLAYLNYGIMQAGSELSWHLSAITFSNKDESFPFSETNILAVGLRGLIVPFLGSLVLVTAGTTTVFLLASMLCLLGTLWLVAPQIQKRLLIPKQ